MSEKLSVALVKSPIGKNANQKKIVAGLGLNKLNKVVELPDTPEIRGMIAKISHMLKIA